MTLATHDALLELLSSRLSFVASKASDGAASSGNMNSHWLLAGQNWPAGSVPPVGGGEACDKATAGALALRDAGAGMKAYLAGLRAVNQGTLATDALIMLYDRLVHTSGLSATVATPQAVATAALSRYASGLGVMAALEIYTSVGATSVPATASYTNEEGVAGRTGTFPFSMGSTAMRSTPSFHLMQLQQGDRGVRSVESVSLSASTGTAGNFGVTLLRPLMWVPTKTVSLEVFDWADVGLLELDDDACVALASVPITSSRPGVTLSLDIVEA